MTESPETGGGAVASRTERKRHERERRFIDAAKRIVTDEGFDSLTMQRLADDLDLTVSAAYRYFPSKGALVRQVQLEAIEHLTVSLDSIRARADVRLVELGLAPADAALTRLVLLGRWLCASSEAYPEDIRLLQMIMSQRTSTLDVDGGWKVFPAAMELLIRAASLLDAAQTHEVIAEGDAVVRAVIWASALGGVLQTDDLEQYAPEMFGGTRLARQASLDLLAGWGADRDELGVASRIVDDLAADGPLAP